MTEATASPGELAVVIPTLGRDTLVPTVDSVLRAEGADKIEIIVAGHLDDQATATALQERLAANPNLQHLDVSFPVGDSSEKKNAGWRATKAEIVAFIDDDVIVAPDWIPNLLAGFKDNDVALVSGPGLVPPDARWFARLAGLALASPAAGYVAWRYRPGEGDAIPIKWSKIIGCNMAYRRSAIEQLGGFDPKFWPGEEMIAAYKTEQSGHAVHFLPTAWVYHYPRHTVSRYIRQIYGYGATRIRLIRAGVDREVATLAPGALVAALLIGFPLALMVAPLRLPWIALIALYALAVAFISVRMVLESGRLKDLGLLVVIPIMHISYGIGEWVELLRPNRDLSVRK